ncbi:MAG: hypothetical protein IKY59_04655, partial [Oscillospiraceae bacterium]|nr:hypothetical protein [Oscillospiraceae bacterium]
LWCSRLARQPVTLEVDGSSPFGVAIKQNTIRKDGVFVLSGLDGLESRHLATVRWTVATGVAFPQKSESVRDRYAYNRKFHFFVYRWVN